VLSGHEKDNPIMIKMDSNKSIKAHFQYTLTITAGTGGTTDPEPGSYTYDVGTEVAITTTPDTGYRFSEWTGDIPSGHEDDNPITITMDSDKSVTSNFIRQYTLTIAAGSGGTTEPAPGSYTYDSGTQIIITALPNSDYKFSNWSGDPSGTTNPITITMDSDKSITANFMPLIFGGLRDDGDDGCFIATAAYGSLLHPYVNNLQDFRDKYLITNKFGRLFVRLYYKYSPYVANIITRSEPLKFIVRIHLVPIIIFSYSMVHLGPIITGVLLFLVIMIPVLPYLRKN